MSFKLIVDKFHNNIELSDFDNRFLKNPIINRMHRILQNSTAYLVFPCCKTSRFEHSIGTLNYASEIFLNGLQNSSVSESYMEDKKVLLKRLVDSDEFKNDFSISIGKGDVQGFKDRMKIETFSELIESQTAYNFLVKTIGGDFINRNIRFIPNSDNDTLYTLLILLQSTRIHALLHDVGHMPFSHLFEFSIENIHNTLKEKKELLEVEELILTNIEGALKTGTVNFFNDQIHEIVGKNLTRFIFADIKNEILNNSSYDINERGLIIFSVCLIQHAWEEIVRGKAGSLNSIYSISSSSIDADRLDYIQRDGAMSGLIRSTGNIDRIVKMFILSGNERINSPDKYTFFPAIQSLFDIEVLLRDRFAIYKYMVNHHAVKRSDYLLQRAIELIIWEEVEKYVKFSASPKVNYLIDTVRVINGLATHEIDKAFKKVAFEFAQINDYWLITLLNKRYIELVIDGSQEFLADILGEIFENRKKVNSLWKRKFEYYKFSVSLGKRVKEKGAMSLDIDKNKVTERTFLKYKELIALIDASESEDMQLDDHHASIGFMVIDLISERYKDNWTRKIEDNCNLENCRILVAPYKNSTGIKDLELIDNKDHTSIMKISDVSTIESSLEEDLKTSTRFFVYYFGPENIEKKVKQCVEDSVYKVLDNIINNKIYVS